MVVSRRKGSDNGGSAGQDRQMKWIDVPPVWLLAFSIVVYWLGQFAPLRLSGLPLIGAGFIAVGLVLIVLAVVEMRKMRTTVIPHMQASHLVSTGVFGLSRNPIYLGDALILAGFCLRWGAPYALILVPVFMWVIATRFIKAEEQRLSAAFAPDFETYCRKTNRWL